MEWEISIPFHCFFLTDQRSCIFCSLLCQDVTGNGFQQLGLLSAGPDNVGISEWGRLELPLNPGTSLFGLLLALIMFLHTSQELSQLNTHINSLGKNLALNLFV